MGQYILDCDGQSHPTDPTCTLSHFVAPPATIDHYTLAPTWCIFLAFLLALAFIIGAVTVRYKAHEERNETERQRILHPPVQCPTCGDRIGA